MARRKKRTLTELELEIMQIVWQQGEVTVKALCEKFERSDRPLALPSIRTMLGILQDKGYVKRRPFGRGYAYSATVSADQARTSILKDIIERAFNGSASTLVTALVNSDMVSDGELKKVRQLVKQHEKGAEE